LGRNFFGDTVFDVAAKHEASVGVDAGKGGEEETDDGEEKKFEGLEKAAEERDALGTRRAVSGIDDEDRKHGDQRYSENGGGDLREGFAENGTGKNRV